MTWHNTSNHIASNDMTSTSSDMTWHATSQLTTVAHPMSPHNQAHYFISRRNFMTSKQVTSPPWNSRSKEMVWASRWSVALRAFYSQILSLTYSFFSLELPPPACPGTTGIIVNILYWLQHHQPLNCWMGRAGGLPRIGWRQLQQSNGPSRLINSQLKFIHFGSPIRQCSFAIQSKKHLAKPLL